MKKFIYLLFVLTILVTAVFYADPYVHSFWQDVQGIIAQLQHYLKMKMTGLTSHLRQGDNLSLVWLVGLSFVYGVTHALGPRDHSRLLGSPVARVLSNYFGHSDPIFFDGSYKRCVQSLVC